MKTLCGKKLPQGHPKVCKVLPKVPKMEPKSQKLAHEVALEATFCQTGRPSYNLRRRGRIACAPPLESSILAHVGRKSHPKARFEGTRKTTPEQIQKRCETVRKTMPQDTQNGTQGHQKSLQILTRERSGGKEVPREASGYPPDEKGWPEAFCFIKNHRKS